MIFSKKTIIIAGVGCIFFFAFLNRIQLILKSEIVVAQAEKCGIDNDHRHFYLYYTYKNIPYKRFMENDISLKDNTTYKLLIKNENPNNFVVWNFWGFYFLPLLLAFIASLAWLSFSPIFFEKIDSFKLSFRKEKEIENETEEK
jgi:hypothetical protein